MTPDDTNFESLIQQFQQGDDEAAQRVLSRYTQQLIRLAHNNLDSRIRQKEDPEDVVQSVYRSFFGRHADGQFTLENWESLWGLLSLLTMRKCSRRAERWRSQKRDVAREQRPRSTADESSVDWSLPDIQATPDDVLQLEETLSELMQPLGDRDQEMISLRLQGFGTDEIAEQVGPSQFTVQAVLRRTKKRLQSMLDLRSIE